MESQSTYELVRTWAGAGGLVFMVAVFIGIVAYALWPGNRKKFDRLAQLPLLDDDKPADPKKAENGKTDSTETGR
ncbi:MAG: cbb3-type cytochrome c oxidase subunit 3 [Parvibaculum sp.]